MSSTPVWIGTWRSVLHNEAYGTLSVPIHSSIVKSKVTIEYNGEIFKNEIISGNITIDSIVIGSKGVLYINNNLNVRYNLIKSTESDIKGIYNCKSMKDKGVFTLTKLM